MALAMMDASEFRIPDVGTMPMLWCGLIISSTGPSWWHVTACDSVAGASAGWIVIETINGLWVLLARSGPGMGGGDAKLLAAIGSWTGWRTLSVVLMIAVVITAAFRFSCKGKPACMPFGPGLAVGGVTAFVMTQWYVTV